MPSTQRTLSLIAVFTQDFHPDLADIFICSLTTRKIYGRVTDVILEADNGQLFV